MAIIAQVRFDQMPVGAVFKCLIRDPVELQGLLDQMKADLRLIENGSNDNEHTIQRTTHQA